MFTQDTYKFDRTNDLAEGELLDGAILYRITSMAHNTETCILNGEGPAAARQKGRFNQPDQLTSYCANNLFVAISEVLYHMHRNLLNLMGGGADYRAIRAEMSRIRSLVVFRVNAIDELVHLDSEGVSRDYSTKVAGTLAVWPDATYEVYDKLNGEFRVRRKNGVIYPSARHSVDKCFALFNDHSGKVRLGEFHKFQILLQLIKEDHRMSSAPEPFSPYSHKVHGSRGFYQIQDSPNENSSLQFEELVRDGWFNPALPPKAGTLDFVRRSYDSYPEQAITPLQSEAD